VLRAAQAAPARVAAHLERSAYSIHFGMIIREIYTQRIGSQQTRAFAHACSVRHAKSRQAKTYSILLFERDAARLRRPSPRSDALSSGQRTSIDPNPRVKIIIQSLFSGNESPRLIRPKPFQTENAHEYPRLYHPNHSAEPCARANDHSCHGSCSEQHAPRQLRSRLIFNVGQKNEQTPPKYRSMRSGLSAD